MSHSRLSRVTSALFLSLALAACASHDGRRSTGQYADDAALSTKVRAALIDTPDLRSNTIQVETYKGVVQLSGFADSQAAANRAVQAARGVSGVKEVRNDIQIRGK